MHFDQQRGDSRNKLPVGVALGEFPGLLVERKLVGGEHPGDQIVVIGNPVFRTPRGDQHLRRRDFELLEPDGSGQHPFGARHFEQPPEAIPPSLEIVALDEYFADGDGVNFAPALAPACGGVVDFLQHLDGVLAGMHPVPARETGVSGAFERHIIPVLRDGFENFGQSGLFHETGPRWFRPFFRNSRKKRLSGSLYRFAATRSPTSVVE